MSDNRLLAGKKAEEAAADLLRRSGYKILVTNYKTKLGEVDIIAREKDTFCFIEVKSRSSGSFGEPSEAVCAAKQRQIAKAALLYLQEKDLFNRKARFDVVSFFSDTGRIELIRNAFDLPGKYSY